MIPCYIIYIIYDDYSKKTEYSAYYNGNILHYEILFGIDPYTECYYYFIKNGLVNLNTNMKSVLKTYFYIKTSYNLFYTELINHVFRHKCVII